MKNLSRLILAAALSAVALPAAAQTQFGADLAISNGQILASEPGRVLGPGVVLVFDKQDDTWSRVAELTASDGEVGDLFGSAVVADGTTLLVAGRGGVYVFDHDGTAWTESGKLEAADVVAGDGYGQALALVGDHAVVGAPGQSDGNGAAYLFRREGGTWSEIGKVTIEETETNFGFAVGFNGTHAVIGAPMADQRTGAAYAYSVGDDGFTEMGKLEVRGMRGRNQYGQGLFMGEDWVMVQAPFANNATGAVYSFHLMDGEWSSVGQLSAFDGGMRTIFGAAVTATDSEVWVGAAGPDGFRGAAYLFHVNETGDDFTGVTKIDADGLGAQAQMASSLATDGAITALGAAGDQGGAGTVVVMEKDTNGDWMRTAELRTPMEGFEPVKGEEVECSAEGDAAGWECSEIDLVSFVPVSELAGEPGVRGIVTNDNWGWQDPETGRYYALVGMTDRASFVDMTDALNPVVIGTLPMTEGATSSSWRDIKTYQNHAYIVSDNAGNHGMQVFDLTRLREFDGEPMVFDEDAVYTDIASAHNIVINEESGFAYSVGSSSGGESCGGGLHIIDIRDPKSPEFAGCFSDPQTGRASTGYTHDAQCVMYRGPDTDHAGKEICFGANETMLSIADVTDKGNTVALSRSAYPSVGYSHQGWLSEDQRWFYMNDELDELQGLVNRTRTMVWDVSDLDDPQLVAEHMGKEESSDHNLYVVGDLMYQSNYQSGLRILNIEDPGNPVEVAYFDTVPYGDNGAGFGGSWSNYPFFDTGLVIVTSGSEGLFIVRPTIRKPISQ